MGNTCVIDIFILLLLLKISNKGNAFLAQDDSKEYLLSFPEFKSIGDMDAISLVFTTASVTDVHVNVSTLKPVIDCCHQKVINRNTVRTFELEIDFQAIGRSKSMNGILVQSSAQITVLALSTGKNTAGSFLALPTLSLGKLYYAVTWDKNKAGHKTEIMIVGLFENTSIGIKLPRIATDPFSTDTAGCIYDVIDRLGTLQIKDDGDLSGTRIEADKEIAVLSGNVRADIGSGMTSDYVVEMLHPVQHLGKLFVVVSTPKRVLPDMIKVVATYPNTKVSLSGSTIDNFTLFSPGESKIIELQTSTGIVIASSKGILVAQFTKNKANGEASDPSLIIVPPVEQWDSEYSFGVPIDSVFDNYVLVVIRDSDKYGIQLDDTIISTGIDTLDNTEYATGYQHLSTGSHVLKHTSGNITFSAILYVTGRTISFYSQLVQNLRSSEESNRDTEISCNISTTSYQTTEPTISNTSSSKTHDIVQSISSEESTVSVGNSKYTKRPSHSTAEMTEVGTAVVGISTLSSYETNPTVRRSTYDRDGQGHGMVTTAIVNGNVGTRGHHCCHSEDMLCIPISRYHLNKTLLSKLFSLRDLLLIHRKNTTRYKRTLHSATDNRNSVALMGHILGVGVLSSVLLLIVSNDIVNKLCILNKRRRRRASF